MTRSCRFRSINFSTVLTCACSSLLLAAGCATRESIPTYPATQPAAVLETVQARSASLRSATGQGTVSLSGKDRGSVRLEAVFVLAPPDRARVRAWKFAQPVIDLTVTPAGVWLYSPHDPAAASNSSDNAAAGIRDWLGYLGSGVVDGSVITDANDRVLTLTAPDARSGGTLTTTIDRPTRIVRSYRLVDASGVERFRLSLDQYREFSGCLWPARIDARSATGTITVETRKLEPNVADENAFKPPARAKRLS